MVRFAHHRYEICLMTLAKALAKSIMIKSVCMLLLLIDDNICMNEISWVVPDLY